MGDYVKQGHVITYTVECRYNAVQYCKLFITLKITEIEEEYLTDAGSTNRCKQIHKQIHKQMLDPQKTPHTSP